MVSGAKNNTNKFDFTSDGMQNLDKIEPTEVKTTENNKQEYPKG